jgi:ABC-2 type transport system permease protein
MNGIWAVTRKEAREIRRDPITLGVALALPVVMLFLFAYGLNLDVTHISTAVLDRDRSPQSVAFVDRFTNSGYFDVTAVVTSYDGVRRLMDAGRINAAVVIPPDFSRHLAAAHPAPVQLIVDGSYPPVARVALAYAEAIGRIASGGALSAAAARMGMTVAPAVNVEPRVWYNPELASKNFLVPGLIAVLLLAFPPMLSTLAIVRERETGSIQQVLVSPLRPWEFVIGKLVPYGAIAFVELLLVLLAGLLWFRVPLRGDLPLLLGISLIYVLAAVGIGLLVSTVTRSQVVAMLLTLVLTFMPSFLFSGFIFPLFTMPAAMQAYTYTFPARFYMEIARGILLKGVGLGVLWPNAAMLLVYTVAILVAASARSRNLR